MTKSDWIAKVKICEECELRKETKDKYGEHQSENLFYSFYYDPANTTSAKFLFIMQNPGMTKDFSKKEATELENAGDTELLSTHQKLLCGYLKKENKIFAKCFFEMLNKHSLINFGTGIWEDYISNEFLSDFIVTDLVKCRAKTSTLDEVKNVCKVCYDTYLKGELSNQAKNKLVFCFSSRTWKTIYNDLKPKMISQSMKRFGKSINPERVAHVHGSLFYSKKLECYLIPLAHFSQTQFNNYLRESYFEYLERGLEEYKKCQHTPTHA